MPSLNDRGVAYLAELRDKQQIEHSADLTLRIVRLTLALHNCVRQLSAAGVECDDAKDAIERDGIT